MTSSAATPAEADPLAAVRVMPEITQGSAFFWSSGRDGLLRILECGECGLFLHPPMPRCRRCRSTEVHPEVVSGRGVVHSFTVNHHAWVEGSQPYVVAIVELAEQEGLRLTTNVVGCDPDRVYIGMDVQVEFLQCDDLYLPLFHPAMP